MISEAFELILGVFSFSYAITSMFLVLFGKWKALGTRYFPSGMIFESAVLSADARPCNFLTHSFISHFPCLFSFHHPFVLDFSYTLRSFYVEKKI